MRALQAITGRLLMVVTAEALAQEDVVAAIGPVDERQARKPDLQSAGADGGRSPQEGWVQWNDMSPFERAPRTRGHLTGGT